MQSKKTYTIDGVECRLKDLTFNETEKVNKILTFDGKTAEVNTLEFFQTVLEPVDSNIKINFGEIKESVQLEVLQDFLLQRIESQLEFKNSFMTSVNALTKSGKNTKH